MALRMGRRVLLAVVWLVVGVGLWRGGEGACYSGDSQALLEFSTAFNDYGAVFASWNATTDCCSWLGVNCTADGRVQGLEIDGSESTTPTSRRPDFQGIPGQSLSRLPLNYLRIFNILFNSAAPSAIGHIFSPMTELTLIGNNFIGLIPYTYGYFPQLTTLVLSSNFSGQIPYELCNLVKIVTFDVGLNSLTGTIPPCITRWRNAFTIRFDSNQFSGPLPNEVGYLSDTLDLLAFSNNRINGVIPIVLSRLSSLRILSLDQNFFTGSIPTQFSQLTNLESLSLSDNPLSGSLPSSLATLPKLSGLFAANANLSGSIDPAFGTISTLNFFDVSGNLITGSLPSTFQTVPATNRLRLDVSGNQLNGTLPDNLHKLYSFNGSGNSFTGVFPISLAGVRSVDVSNNQLTGFPTTGSFPPNVAIRTLSLSNNKITGNLPPWFLAFNTIETIDLSQNNISGPLPGALLTLPSLIAINISNNQIASQLPSVQSSTLKVLDVHQNLLFGQISIDFILKLPNLQCLDLSFNALMGAVPPNLPQASSLKFLNLVGNTMLSYCTCAVLPHIP